MNDETNGVPALLQEPKPPVAAKDEPFDFMPKNLGEAMELARMLSESTMVPRDYIGKPGNCFIAMQHGSELGLKPVQALQSIAVINGKPGIYGDAGKALLLKHGCIVQELDVRDVEQRGYAQCTINRAGRPAVTRTFSKEDATRARLWGKDGPWTLYPYRQMAWRAFWFAARDAAADILKGLPPAEELRDMAEIDITPQGETLPPGASAQLLATSASSKLKERIKPKAAAVDVAVLATQFEVATTTDELAIAVERVRKAELSDSDRNLLTLAYRAALARVTKKAEPQPSPAPAETATSTATSGAPEPLTDEQIMAGLRATKTRDEIDLYCSVYVSPLEEGPRKGLLLTHYNKARAELEE